jgi:hypothetical protein
MSMLSLIEEHRQRNMLFLTDRLGNCATAYESEGKTFESFRARHYANLRDIVADRLGKSHQAADSRTWNLLLSP